MNTNVPFEVIREDYSVYEVENGQILKVKQSITEIINTDDPDPAKQSKISSKTISVCTTIKKIDTSDLEETTPDETVESDQTHELTSGDHHPQTLRRMLTRTLVEGSDRRARLIGAEAYEAAGGTIIRDLFRIDDDGYFTDSQLLDGLVAEKLAAEADKMKAENWSWVEVMSEVDYGYTLTHVKASSVVNPRMI